MALISKPYTYSPGEVIASAKLNSNLDTIYNDYNGGITNANLSGNAGITAANLATITTEGKVNLTALVATSQATGDVMYASSASVWSRLAKGTAYQLLRMNSGATLPEWGAVYKTMLPSGTVIQTVYKTLAEVVDCGANALPIDDTIPLITDGGTITTQAITPTASGNLINVWATTVGCPAATKGVSLAVFAGTTYVCGVSHLGSSLPVTLNAIGQWTTLDANEVTFTLRAGCNDATKFYAGARDTTGNRLWGGAVTTTLILQEVVA